MLRGYPLPQVMKILEMTHFVLGLRGCRGFSICGKQGPPEEWRAGSSLGGFSCCRSFGSRVWGLQQLQPTGWEFRLPGRSACSVVVAPQHVGSSRIEDRTHVSCVGRWVPHHWATREAQEMNISRHISIDLSVCFAWKELHYPELWALIHNTSLIKQMYQKSVW